MSKPILLDFSATWCGPCKMQKPILKELEKKYEGSVEIKEIDVDQNRELAAKYMVQAVPTLIIEKDGKTIKRWAGVTQAHILIEELDKLL